MTNESKRSKITDEHISEAKRLKALWEARPEPKKTQAEFGELYKLGNQANVGHYLNARSALNPKAAAAFASELKCEVSDFSPRIAKEIADLAEAAPAASEDEFFQVRHFAVKFSNGHGRFVHDESSRPGLSFRADFLRKLGISQRNAVVVDSTGDSNYPLIQEGAAVLIDRASISITPGKFYAFRVGSELLIKMLTPLEDGSILAVPANSSYQPRVFREGDDFEIIGRAKWTCHEL